jgi:hypothetical protein
MNKVNIEKHGDGTFTVTMPGGAQRQCGSLKEVINALRHEENEFQMAIDDIKKRREECQSKAANP